MLILFFFASKIAEIAEKNKQENRKRSKLKAEFAKWIRASKYLMMTSANSTSPPTKRMSSHANSYQRQQHNYFNKLLIILIVILINCIVGNLCAWQDNVRPKLFVQLGKSLKFIYFPSYDKNPRERKTFPTQGSSF